MAGKVPKVVSESEPISAVTSVTNPIKTENVAGTQINPATEDTLAAQLDITLSALRDAIKEYLARVTEVSVASGDATGGSTTTLVDSLAVWEVNKWTDAIVEITDISANKHYYVTVVSNTATTLTFAAIAVTVVAGDYYEIRMALNPANIEKWGGTNLTGRDISADSLALVTALQGIQAVIGAVGVAANPDGLLLAQQRYIAEAANAIKTAIQGIQANIGAVGAASDVDGLLLAQLRYIGEAANDLKTAIVLATGSNQIGKLAANTGVDIGDVDVTSLPSVTTATNTKVSVGSSDTTVLASSATRKFAVFVNDSDETIYLSLSATAVQGEGIRLNAGGGAYEINLMNLYTGEVSAICTSGGKYLTVVAG